MYVYYIGVPVEDVNQNQSAIFDIELRSDLLKDFSKRN